MLDKAIIKIKGIDKRYYLLSKFINKYKPEYKVLFIQGCRDKGERISLQRPHHYSIINKKTNIEVYLLNDCEYIVYIFESKYMISYDDNEIEEYKD